MCKTTLSHMTEELNPDNPKISVFSLSDNIIQHDRGVASRHRYYCLIFFTTLSCVTEELNQDKPDIVA